MNSRTLRYRVTHFSLVILVTFVSAASSTNIPRLSVFHDKITRGTSKPISVFSSDHSETHFYPQTLDHFNYQPGSYATFKQKYLINYEHWGGANESAPILVYLGAEDTIDNQHPVSVLANNAAHFKALQVYIEHRFYGESIPLGTMEDAMKNETTRGCFNSAQALVDSAKLILYLKEKLSAHNSPVIVSGGSYGGMLATWFRLKYPHVALGALASSAPILHFHGITPPNAYSTVVTKDFKEVSESCYETIRKSWYEIDRVASKPNGLAYLSRKFKTCFPLTAAKDLKDYLIQIYDSAAQYDWPPVTQVCGRIDGAKGKDVLGKIFAGIFAPNANQKCFVNQINTPSDADIGWNWQACSEMVMPIGRGGKDTMFQPNPFNLKKRIMECESEYGILPRPNWVTTYYGGHDIKLVLKRFASNIIFSNGLRDPYSSGGVLEDLSDTLIAVYTINGSHCLDINMAMETDPQWLIDQRKVEVKIMDGWLKSYYADLYDLR